MLIEDFLRDCTKESGIYKITNTISNKVYIGSAVVLKRRLTSHYTSLLSKTHHNQILQRSWNKHGYNNFHFEIVEIVENENNLINREQYWIDFYTSYNRKLGYNIAPIAGSSLGIARTDETKQRISKSKRELNSKAKKINEKTASLIKSLLNEGKKPSEISESIGISKDLIRAIKEGKSWTYIDPQLRLPVENFQKKLSDDNVLSIHKMLSDGLRVKDIAEIFDVNYRTISAIKNNKTWSSVNVKHEYEKRANLTEAEVLEIKIMINNGKSNIEISEKFKTARNTISNIRNNKSWSHIKVEEVS